MLKIYQSWLGAALAVIYTSGAVYVVQDELRNTSGGWINLRGMGTTLITAPSQVTFGLALGWLGVPEVDYAQPGLGDYCQLVLHVAITAAVVYLFGYGIEWATRRWLLPRLVS
jgi:TRAP-type C4-dicarboxylate transport system permease small subunit